MQEETKNLVQAIAGSVTALSAVVAVFKFVYDRNKDKQQRADELQERKNALVQRKADLRWKRQEMAKKLVDEMLASDRCKQARTMIDYPSGRDFVIEPSKRVVKIDRTMYLKALTIREDATLTEEEHFIRDSFDKFFYFCGITQQWIEREVVEQQDVVYPLVYYVSKLMEPSGEPQVIDSYLKRYHFERTQRFFKSVPKYLEP